MCLLYFDVLILHKYHEICVSDAFWYVFHLEVTIQNRLLLDKLPQD